MQNTFHSSLTESNNPYASNPYSIPPPPPTRKSHRFHILMIILLTLILGVTSLSAVYYSNHIANIPPVTTPASTISITTPMQLSPLDGSMLSNFPRTTRLIWEDTSQQVTYTIEIQYKTIRVNIVGNNITPILPWYFTDMMVVSKLDSQTSEYDFEFVGKQEGRWRIWAVDSAGHESPKSPWWTFTYTA